jgi:hypothetical protein
MRLLGMLLRRGGCQRRTRARWPPAAAVETGQQHRRAGIIAPTLPAVRVRITNPHPLDRICRCKTYERAGYVSRDERGRRAAP